MSKYDVYGIGNALVDMVFAVSDDWLKKMEIDKGVMTLVDEVRQKELLAALAAPCLERTCGGSAANTVMAMAMLGGKTFYSCKVANDALGDFYAQDLAAAGVESNLPLRISDGITGKCMVFVGPDAQRSMNTYLGITQSFSVNELVEEKLKEAKYLYIEGYLVASPTGKGAAINAHELALKYGVKTALTFSDPNMVGLFKAGIDQIIGRQVDILFCNEEEAKTYTDYTDLESAAMALKAKAKTFAITLGPKGCYVYNGKEFFHIAAPAVNAVDTNGAGDLFAGAFLYAITHGHDYYQAAQFAVACASKLVAKIGPRLDGESLREIAGKILG